MLCPAGLQLAEPSHRLVFVVYSYAAGGGRVGVWWHVCVHWRHMFGHKQGKARFSSNSELRCRRFVLTEVYTVAL